MTYMADKIAMEIKMMIFRGNTDKRGRSLLSSPALTATALEPPDAVSKVSFEVYAPVGVFKITVEQQ